MAALVGDKEQWVATVAATKIGELGPAARSAMPALLRALPREQVGLAAAGALARLDPGNSPAKRLLLEVVTEPTTHSFRDDLEAQRLRAALSGLAAGYKGDSEVTAALEAAVERERTLGNPLTRDIERTLVAQAGR